MILRHQEMVSDNLPDTSRGRAQRTTCSKRARVRVNIMLGQVSVNNQDSLRAQGVLPRTRTYLLEVILKILKNSINEKAWGCQSRWSLNSLKMMTLTCSQPTERKPKMISGRWNITLKIQIKKGPMVPLTAAENQIDLSPRLLKARSQRINLKLLQRATETKTLLTKGESSRRRTSLSLTPEPTETTPKVTGSERTRETLLTL